MSAIIWDAIGEKRYENGVSHGVLYPLDSTGAYENGVAWNGLTSVSNSPDGAEPNDIYADNIKYGSLRSAENYKGTIEAYMYPDEFAECDGSAEPVPGVSIGQQNRKSFGFSYRTEIGNDANPEAGYKIHLIYGATASPSEKSYETVNDSPDAMTFSWDFDTIPVAVAGYKPTAHMEIDSTKVDSAKLRTFEDMLYGNEQQEPTLPMPSAVIAMFGTNS